MGRYEWFETLFFGAVLLSLLGAALVQAQIKIGPYKVVRLAAEALL